jgi:hypothetical protein
VQTRVGHGESFASLSRYGFSRGHQGTGLAIRGVQRTNVGLLLLALAGCGTGMAPSTIAPSASPSTSLRPATTATPSATTTAAPASTVWHSVAVPEPTSAGLLGIACVSATECWAVGSLGGTQGVIERLEGNEWSVAANADHSTILTDVSCASSNDCWAVGGGMSSGSLVSVFDHFTGQAWTPSATSLPSQAELLGITCLSNGSCWAVGSLGDQPVVASYAGARWAVAESPSIPSGGAGELNDVWCVTSSNCWAVGKTGFQGAALIEHYDGSTWTLATSPSLNVTVGTSMGAGELMSIDCLTANDCWSVGDLAAFGGTSPAQFLVEHWDGNAWAVAPTTTPSGLGEYAALNGVSCAPGDDCWAAGGAVLEHYGTSGWTSVDAPAFSGGGAFDVSCSGNGVCWAVGTTATGPASATNSTA